MEKQNQLNDRENRLKELMDKKNKLIRKKSRVNEKITPLGELKSSSSSRNIHRLVTDKDSIYVGNVKKGHYSSNKVGDSVENTLKEISRKRNKIQKIIHKNNREHRITILEDVFNDYVFFTTEYGFQLYPTKQKMDTHLISIYNKKYELFKEALEYMYQVAANIKDYKVIITPNSEGGINKLSSIIKKRALESRILNRTDYLDLISKHGKSFMYVEVVPNDSSKQSRRFSINSDFVFFDDPNKDRTKKAEVYKNIDITRKDTFGIRYSLRELLFKEYIINSYYDMLMNMYHVIRRNQ